MLCCGNIRKDTPTLMAEYDAFLKRDAEYDAFLQPATKRRPTTAPAALDQQPGGERKPSVKEIIRSRARARWASSRRASRSSAGGPR